MNNTNSRQQQIHPIDDWFSQLGDNQIGECLRLYAQACNNRLAPYLTQVIQDRSLFDTGDTCSAKQSSANVSETMPPTPDGGIPIKTESSGRF